MGYEISVCVPVYNVEKYFGLCLQSLFTQTMLNGVEFIFVNDCTPDSSMDILDHYLQKYSVVRDHVKIFKHEHNKGLAAARNTAVHNATGEYLIHVDSDDWVEPNYLEELYKTITEHNADIAICNCSVIYANGKTGSICQPFPPLEEHNAVSYTKLAFSNKIIPVLWTKLVRRKIYSENKIIWTEGINKGEDVITTLKLFSCSSKISYTQQKLYNYRFQVGFTTKQATSALIRQDIAVCNEIVAYFKEKSLYDQFKNEILAKQAMVRYNFIIHEKWFSFKKYKTLFPEVQLNNITLFQTTPRLRRQMFYFFVDKKLYFFANLYLFILKKRIIT